MQLQKRYWRSSKKQTGSQACSGGQCQLNMEKIHLLILLALMETMWMSPTGPSLKLRNGTRVVCLWKLERFPWSHDHRITGNKNRAWIKIWCSWFTCLGFSLFEWDEMVTIIALWLSHLPTCVFHHFMDFLFNDGFSINGLVEALQ